MTTRVTLLCHAATSANRASAFAADEPLEPQALRKLSQVTHRLDRADRRRTSPALRARQTAETLGLDAAVDLSLRDCGYGRWTGDTLDEIRAREPDGLAAWLRDPGAAPHGGESILHLLERVGLWLDAQAAEPGRVLAITHASVIRAAIVHAIGAPPGALWRIDVAPLSMVRLSGHGGRWAFSALGPFGSPSTATVDNTQDGTAET